MRHREFIDGIDSFVKVRSEPAKVLDLGCGDGYLAANAFRGLSIRSYVGVDLSRDALERLQARGPFGHPYRSVGCPEILCCDIRSALDSFASASVDTVLASFSLHHFDHDTKRIVLGQIRRVLSQNGLLLWIDVARSPEESRDSYIRRIADWIKRDWDCLSSEEREASVQHVIESDFPETEAGMIGLATAQNLNPIERIYADDYYCGWVFQ